MKALFLKALFLASLLLAHFPLAFADPGVVYRCGNEYLNDAAQAQARGCAVLEGNGVAVTVNGTRVLSRAVESQPAPTRPPALSPAPSPVQARVAANTPAKTTWRTDSAEQRARDRDAFSILQAELAKAEALLAERQRELANPQRPAARLGDLQSSISRHLSDIAGLKREISRLPVR